MRPTPDPRLLASSLHPCCFTQFLYFIDRFPSKGSKGFALFNAVFNIFISMLKRFTTKVAVSRRQLVHWVKQIKLVLNGVRAQVKHGTNNVSRSEEHTSELQSRPHLV